MSVDVLVTGAGGLLGGHVVQRLLAEGRTVAATFRHESGQAQTRSDAQWVQCNLTDRESVGSLLRRLRPSQVVHAAATIKASADVHEVIEDNVLATAVLVNEALKHGCSRMVFCSSISVYEGIDPVRGGFRESQAILPKGRYATSKAVGESILRLGVGTDFKGCSLRLAGLHGVGRKSGVIFNMLSAARADAPVHVNDPNSRYRFLFLSDAVEAVLLALKAPLLKNYNCYNVASFDVCRLTMLASTVVRMARSRSRVERDAVRPAVDQVMNIAAICRDLKFKPRSLQQGLAETWKWLKSGDVAGR